MCTPRTECPHFAEKPVKRWADPLRAYTIDDEISLKMNDRFAPIVLKNSFSPIA
jgi:hypothetical protein